MQRLIIGSEVSLRPNVRHFHHYSQKDILDYTYNIVDLSTLYQAIIVVDINYYILQL